MLDNDIIQNYTKSYLDIISGHIIFKKPSFMKNTK